MHMLKQRGILNAICTSASCLPHIRSCSESVSANQNFLTNASNIFLNHVTKSNKVFPPQKSKKKNQPEVDTQHRKLKLRCFKFKNVISNWKQGHITKLWATSIVTAQQHRFYFAFSFKEKKQKFMHIFQVAGSMYVYVQLLLSGKDPDMMEEGRRLYMLHTIPSHMAQNLHCITQTKADSLSVLSVNPCLFLKHQQHAYKSF